MEVGVIAGGRVQIDGAANVTTVAACSEDCVQQSKSWGFLDAVSVLNGLIVLAAVLAASWAAENWQTRKRYISVLVGAGTLVGFAALRWLVASWLDDAFTGQPASSGAKATVVEWATRFHEHRLPLVMIVASLVAAFICGAYDLAVRRLWRRLRR